MKKIKILDNTIENWVLREYFLKMWYEHFYTLNFISIYNFINKILNLIQTKWIKYRFLYWKYYQVEEASSVRRGCLRKGAGMNRVGCDARQDIARWRHKIQDKGCDRLHRDKLCRRGSRHSWGTQGGRQGCKQPPDPRKGHT